VAADAARRRTSAAGHGISHDELVQTLLCELLETLTSPEHRMALQRIAEFDEAHQPLRRRDPSGARRSA
jgi:hypothetical protein